MGEQVFVTWVLGGEIVERASNLLGNVFFYLGLEIVFRNLRTMVDVEIYLLNL